MKKLFFIFYSLVLLLFLRVSWAEEVQKVKEIVIELPEERAIQERKECSYAKTIITKKEMEELGGQTAADLLRRLPRLYFSGPPATNKDIRMFGLDKEFQNVLINGNRPPGGGEKREFALDRIPVEMIERIEVMKNPTASYDADAIAGLVNIILREPPKAFNFRVSGGASYNDLASKVGNRLTINYGDKKGPFSFSTGGTRNDDYRGKEKTVEDRTVKNESEKEDETVRTITSSIDLNLAYEIGKRDKVTFKPYLLNQKEEKSKEKTIFNLTTGVPKSKNVESEDKEQNLESYSLEWQHQFISGSNLKLFSSYSRNDEDKDKKIDQYKNATMTFNKNIFENEEKKDTETVLSADYKTLISGAFDIEQLLSMGIKYRHKNRNVDKLVYEISNTGTKKIISIPDDSYTLRESILAVYIMDEFSILEKFIITPGLRVEITDGEYTTSGGRFGKGDFTDWNPSLHALFKFGEGYQLRASTARTIGRPPFKDKVPTRSEKTDRIEEGNSDLKASKSMNYEASIEKYIGNSGFISVGAFYKDVRDIVEKQQIGIDTSTGKSIYKPVNVSEATIKGMELELKLNLYFLGIKDFTFAGNYTVLDSEVKDPNTGVTRSLKDQPKNLANAVLRYNSNKLGLSASLGVNYIGEKIDQTDPAKPKKVEKAYTQWDLSVNKTLFKYASLFGSVTNIFNEKREKTEGLRTEKEESGRTFFIGLRYEI